MLPVLRGASRAPHGENRESCAIHERYRRCKRLYDLSRTKVSHWHPLRRRRDLPETRGGRKSKDLLGVLCKETAGRGTFAVSCCMKTVAARPFAAAALFFRKAAAWGKRKGDEDVAQGEMTPFPLTEKERKLIQLLREIRFGEVHLHMADGQPVRIEEVKKSIKL